MSTSNKRDLWDAHLRDEQDAHDLQQVSAGPTHHPVEGPLPHTARDMEDAVTTAVLAERERCRRIALRWADDNPVAQRIADEIAGG